MKQKKYTLLFLLFCLANIGYTQTSLSLSEAIQIGLKRNHDIIIETKKTEIAANNNSWGQAGRYPTINLDLGQNNGVNSNVKTAFPTSTRGDIISSSLTPGINVNWVLFNGFSINIAKQTLENIQRESEGNAEVVIANTIQTIITGYYTAVLEKERLKTFQKQLELSLDKYKYAEEKVNLGSASKVDILLEESNVLTDSSNFIIQKLNYENALRRLNFILAEEDAEKKYNLTDKLNTVPAEYALSDLHKKMEDENVDLKKQYISQLILKDAIQSAKANRYPTVSINLGINETRQSLNLSNASFFTGEGFANGPEDPLHSITDNYFANFSLSFTLFNGGKVNRAIKNAIINEEIGNIRTDKLKLSLRTDLNNAYQNYNLRKQLYAIAQRKQLVAKANLEISQELFKNGSINSLDYREIQNIHLSAATEKLQAMYNLTDANITLTRLTGGLVKTHLPKE